MRQKPQLPLLERANFKQHQLEVFCTVAQHLSYRRAAEALYLSQPAVTQQIKALKEMLGVPLLERRGRGIVLTPFGQELLPHTERLLRLLRETAPVVRQIESLERGSVLLGASMSTGAYVVPQLLRDFHSAHPQIRLMLKVANRLTTEEDLLNHQIDLAVIGLIQHPERFVVEFLMRNDLIIVAPASHPLAGSINIPLSKLQEERFLLREPGSGTRLDTEELFKHAGLHMHNVMEWGDTGAIKEAVSAKMGIAVVFRQSVALEMARGELVELKVQGFPLERRWHVVHLGSRRLSHAASALREHLLLQAAAERGSEPGKPGH